MELAGQADTSVKAIRSALARRGLSCHTKYCRQIFSTHLKMSGIDSELINILQGRVPKSVFARFYNKSNFEQDKVKVLIALKSLHKTMSKEV